jgi:hypothetical protein
MDERHLLATVRYMELNPVRTGFVERAMAHVSSRQKENP